MARKQEAAFPNVVFGVAPMILNDQLDDQLVTFLRAMLPERLMAENGAPMMREHRATNHPWAAEESSNNQGCSAAYNEEVVSVVCSGTVCVMCASCGSCQ